MSDFYNIDSALSEEERAVRDTIRAFVDEKVLPIIGDCYIEGRFPRELIPQMAELGFFGANLPEEYGCAGLNNVAYGLIMQALERGDRGARGRGGGAGLRRGSGCARHLPDLRLRIGRAEEEVAAAARERAGYRLLRA